MAENTASLKMVFNDENGKKLNVNVNNYVKTDITDAQAKALMDGYIANGELFADVPYEKVSAQLVKTETIDLDVEDI